MRRFCDSRERLERPSAPVATQAESSSLSPIPSPVPSPEPRAPTRSTIDYAMAPTLLEKVWDAHTVRKLPERADAAVRRPASGPRGDDAAGVRHAAGARVEGALSGAGRSRRSITSCRRAISGGRSWTSWPRTCCRRSSATAASAGIPLLDLNSGSQGIVHVIGPELGLTQPGMTIACGDSHTSTHGAFGAVAFGIGTSQVRDVLASQCLALEPLKVRRIEVRGTARAGVYAKDIILEIIRRLGVNGGVGYAYEYAGDTIERLSMDERMTICNMSIEGGARVGYVNPDQTTFDYLRGRRFAPQGDAFERAVAWWREHGLRSGRALRRRRSRSTRRRSGRR